MCECVICEQLVFYSERFDRFCSFGSILEDGWICEGVTGTGIKDEEMEVLYPPSRTYLMLTLNLQMYGK
jgi:hypothetical protein